MIPNLNFIKTLVNGLFSKMKSVTASLEKKIAVVDSKIHTPDYDANEGEDGFIKNKPVLIGRRGGGNGAEVFNDSSNVASGMYSHAEGSGTKASGDFSHSEGRLTKASEIYSHAEGYETSANGIGSHAEGGGTSATGRDSHAEGDHTIASYTGSHAEGYYTSTRADYQHVQGKCNVTDSSSKYAHIVGNGSGITARSNAHTLDWDGNAWFAGDVYVGSTSGTDKDEGSKKLATEEFVENAVKNSGSSGGSGVGAAGTGEYAEVFNGGAAENASGTHSHAEGLRTIASSLCSHAEGQGSKASSEYSHAEGWDTAAEGMAAHAEGIGAIANGFCSHAEGTDTLAKGEYSHAEGEGTIAASGCQHVEGSFNIEDAARKYLHIVGNGYSSSSRSNAHTLDWNGNAWFAGTVEGTALILTSSGGKRFRITVDDDGTLQSAEVTA